MRCPANIKDAEARLLWSNLNKNYTFDLHEIVLVRKLCEAVQTANLCQASLDEKGVTQEDRHGKLVPHPGIASQAVAIRNIAMICKHLNLANDIRPELPNKARFT